MRHVGKFRKMVAQRKVMIARFKNVAEVEVERNNYTQESARKGIYQDLNLSKK